MILHSRADDVMPLQDSLELPANSGLPATALIEVRRDHRLAVPEPLEALLRAVAGSRTSEKHYFSAGDTPTDCTSNLNGPGFLSLSMKPRPVMSSGCTGPMP